MSGDEFNIVSSLQNTTWEAELAGGGVITENSFSPLEMSEDKPFKVEFTEVNLANKTVTISTDGLFTVQGDSAVSYDVGPTVGTLSGSNSNSITLPVSKIGFNTWYASSEHSQITVILTGEEECYVSVIVKTSETSGALFAGKMRKQ